MKAFYDGMAEEIKVSDKHIEDMVTPAIISSIAGAPDIIRTNVEEARKKIASDLAANKAMEPFSVWKLIGIDPDSDEGKEQIDAIKEVASKITDAIDKTLTGEG